MGNVASNIMELEEVENSSFDMLTSQTPVRPSDGSSSTSYTGKSGLQTRGQS